MTRDYAIIPVREFSNGKLRLKDALSDYDRTSLSASLLKRVTNAVVRSRMERLVIVASNPLEVGDCVGNHPKITIISEKEHHGGVNEAMMMGIKFSKSAGAVTTMLLPSDLPFVSHSKINQVLEAMNDYEMVIVGSRKRDGTNLLSMRATIVFTLHYDDNSFVKHAQEATIRRLEFLSPDYSEFSMDLDDANDLRDAMKIYQADSFGKFIQMLEFQGV